MKTQKMIETEKKSFELLLNAIDGKYYSITLLGINKIISKKEFNKLKEIHLWSTDF